MIMTTKAHFYSLCILHVAGRLVDADGNFNDWWQNASAVHFEEKSKCFIDQYNQFTVHGEPV